MIIINGEIGVSAVHDRLILEQTNLGTRCVYTVDFSGGTGRIPIRGQVNFRGNLAHTAPHESERNKLPT